MAYENILLQREGPVATITVNRPKSLNALNSATLRELTQAVRECADARALILTGAGEKAFVAGADISEMAPMGRSEEHTSELQSQSNLVCRLLLEKKKQITT